MGASKVQVTHLQLLGLATWLMKDLGWVLLLAPLAFSSAVLAVGIEIHTTFLDWATDSGAVRVHGLATVLWILGNAIWMTVEILWDATVKHEKHGEHGVFPWHEGPLFGKHETNYWTGVNCSRILFAAAICSLVVFYVRSALNGQASGVGSRSKEPQEAESGIEIIEHDFMEDKDELVWGFITPKVYLMIFIGPWIAKDLFWSYEMLGPALICSSIVIALSIDGFRRFQAMACIVEIWWIIGNTIWITGELSMDPPARTCRILAAACLFIGIGIACYQLHVQGKEQLDASETTPLQSTKRQRSH